jgi:peptide/nickel transport system substrate-binding protein
MKTLELRRLEDLLSQGRINRREFLVRLSALGFVAALLPSLPAASSWAATPKKGGRLRLGMAGGSTTDSLDPGTTDAAVNQNITWQLRNNLVEIDRKGNAIPELAESWEPTPDAAQWTFKLRRGVEFHNGKTLEAEDIIFSINHHRGAQSKSAAKSYADPIKDIKADGKYAVVFTLDSGNADFPYVLSDIHFCIMPANTNKFLEIGTGGYQLVSYEPGVRTLTKRNPNYWKEGCAHFDEVEIIVISDVTARTNALMTGKIDAINWCELKTIHLLEKEPGIQIVRATGRKHFTMPMLTDVPPFDNNDVRLALKYAIDRNHIMKMVLRGYGVVGNDHPIAPIMRYHASELPQREYDPDKAKFHLRKAGLTDHVFKLHTAPNAVFGGAVDTCLLYSQHAAKAGIKIEVVRESDDGYFKKIWMNKPWCMCYWSGRPTEDMMFSSGYAEGSKFNDSHWKDQRFNNLLKEARAELNEVKRRQMYVEMQRIVRDEGGVVVPMFADFVDAASKKLQFAGLSGHYELDGQRCAERWWFEA